MKTTDAMAGDPRTGATIGDPDAREASSGSRPDSWDPREVWLTRIRQPRDRIFDTEAVGKRASVGPGDEPG